MKQEVLIGQTDYSVLVMMRDDAGAPATALAHTDIDIAYARVETDNDVTTSDVAPADLANLTAAHSDWGWEVVSATDHPGLYRLDIADAVFASGAWSAVVSITGTGLDPCHLEFILVPSSPSAGVLLAPTTHTSAVIPTVTTTGTATNLTNLPAITSNWLTAAGIADDAFTAAKFATDAFTNDVLASSFVTEMQSGLATSSALATAQADLDIITGTAGAKIDVGTGAGQLLITSGVADMNWVQTLGDAITLSDGTAQAGAAGSITLAAGASSVNNYYRGQVVWINGGTGEGQRTNAVAYNGTSKVLSVYPPFSTAPDNTSTYVLESGGSSAGRILAQGTIGATGNSTTALHLTGLTFGDDELNDCLLVIFDVSTGEHHCRWIEDWADTGDLATVATLPFTPENSVDTYWILPIRQDVSGGSGLDAAGVRAALGYGSASHDTDISGLNTKLDTIDNFLDLEIAAILADTDELQTDWVNGGRLDLLIDAIKAKTDQFAFGTANRVNAQVFGMESDTITSGAVAASAVTEIQSGLATSAALATLQTSVDDLPTNAELATSQAAADDATLAAIAALNNLSAANVLTQVETALATTTRSLPGQVTPSTTPTLAEAIMQIFQQATNPSDQSDTLQRIYNRAGSVVHQKRTVGESGGVVSMGALATGP